MKYFTEDYLTFFKELAANNHKDWFDENRKRYETNVKKAFEVFVTDLITAVSKEDPSIVISYKEAIFRINKDIRFSKDKTPYKLNRSAIISPKGRKDKAFPGLYIEMGPEYYRIYGGVYAPDKEQLYMIREQLKKNPKKIKELIKDSSFIEHFWEIRGEENKILKPEFKAAAADLPLLYKKQFYWFKELAPSTILQDDLLAITMEAYRANKPLMDYFGKAMV
jgi:uncharacterized protein (TIGR02453 family)